MPHNRKDLLNAFFICRKNVQEEAKRNGYCNMCVISKVAGILWKKHPSRGSTKKTKGSATGVTSNARYMYVPYTGPDGDRNKKTPNPTFYSALNFLK